MAKGKLPAPLGKAERSTRTQNDAQDTNNKPPPAQAPASSPGQAAAQTDTSSVATQRYRKIDPARRIELSKARVFTQVNTLVGCFAGSGLYCRAGLSA